MSGSRPCFAALTFAALFLGACQSDGGSTATPGGAAGTACTVASATLVSEKLGFTLAEPNVDRGPTATVCTYDNPSVQSQAATIQVQTTATAESFAKTREGFATHGEPVTALPGLGDEAYSASLTVANLTNSTLAARKGTVEVLITSTAPTDRLAALMTAILPLV